MRKMKRITSSALLAMSLAFSLMACGTKSEPTTTEASTEAATTTETTVAATKAETEASTDTTEDKIKVGVSWNADEIDEDAQLYLDAVEKAGGEAVYLPQIKTEEDAKNALAEVDALVVTGGEDIDPSYYNAEPDEKLEDINEARDTSDSILITEALDEDIPMLATCRGMQFLNVLSGGALYQDLSTQNPSEIVHRDQNHEEWVKHEITVDADNIVADAFGGAGTYIVNSWHHQAVDKLGDNLKVVATAPDGVVEAIVREDKTYVMGLQFHPEAMIDEGDDSFLTFYTNLIDQAKEAA